MISLFKKKAKPITQLPTMYTLGENRTQDFIKFIESCRDSYLRYGQRITFREVMNIGFGTEKDNMAIYVEYLEWEGLRSDRDKAEIKVQIF